MGTPITYLSGGTRGYELGIFKDRTTGLGFTFPLSSNYRWWNGVDVTSTQYLLYSDLNSVGQSTVANSRPTAWTTPDLTDQSLLNLINTLPERVGLPAFTSISAGLQWLQSTGTYFLIKTGYENIATTNLQLNYDAGWYNSYNGSGTAVYDLSGNNRTGTLVNGTGFNSSGVGTFVFDGSNDYINVGSITYTNALTVEAWIKTSSLGGWGDIIAGGCGAVLFGVTSSATGKIGFGGQCNSPFTPVESTISISDNQWHHVVGTYNGSTASIYIDGVLNISASRSGNFSNATLYVGSAGGGENFDGSISIARVYTLALTAEQVLQNYNAQKNRFGITSMVQDSLLSLDAGNYASYPQTGTNWFNLSSTNYNADLINGVSWASTSGGTFNFDGSDDYATITSLNNFNFGSSITVGAWLRNIGGDYRGVISNVYSTGTGFDMRFGRENWSGGTNNGTALNLAVRTSSGNYGHTVDGTLNSWGYYAYTYNGSSLTSYKNGNVFSGGTSATGTLGSVANNVVIGARNILGEYFNSSISNLHIYTRPLASSEIQQNFYALADRYGLGIVRNGLVLNFDAGNNVSYPSSGATWFDIGGGMYDATLLNGPTFSNDGYGAIDFDGTNDFGTLAEISNLFTGDVTAECWFRIDGAPTDWVRLIGTGGNGGNRTFGLWYNWQDDYFLWQRYTPNTDVLYTYTPMAQGVWYHLVGLTNGSTQKLFLNGVEIGSGTRSGPWGVSNEPLRIAYAGFHTYHNGLIGSIRLYNRGLSDSEVLVNFNSQKGRYGL